MQNFSSSSAPLVSPLPGVIRADGITFIRASGEDAVKFLHGQLSQAVEGLGERTTLAGYCSPKGRLLAIVRVWMDGPDVMLALPASMAEGFLKRLRMYVLRAKVRLEPVSPMPATLLFAGEAGRAAAAGLGLALPDAGAVLRSNGWTLLGLAPSRAIEGFCAGGPRALAIPPEGFDAASLNPAPDAWRTASVIAAGVPQVLAETRELFVPQHVNLELAGGVSFRKGCYPGQEVVSRVQHIGETNRRAAIGRIARDVAARPGDPVYAQGDEAGHVVLASRIGGETLVLFSATLGALLSGVSLEPAGEAMELVELPYRYRNILKDPA